MEDLPQRKIIHIDMDAFYASVEQLDNPDLKGKPVAVGGNEVRGVVAAASYEARKFGVKSAMSSALAKRKCPDLIFVKANFSRYKEVSKQIRTIFLEYTDLVEPLALDEAFLDVTANIHNHQSATEIAKEIRSKILKTTGLTASAGISINKFMAKIASNINKPNGQKTIKPHEVIPFLETLPIQKFFGVGKVTAEKMQKWGIYNGAQLKQHSIEFLTQQFGKSGAHFYHIVRGIQFSEVKPNRIRKSVGTENTYHEDKVERKEIIEALDTIAQETERRLKSIPTRGRTITVKLKFNDFTVQTRSKTSLDYLDSKEDIFTIVVDLIDQSEIPLPVRLLGISISNLESKEPIIHEEAYQLSLDF